MKRWKFFWVVALGVLSALAGAEQRSLSLSDAITLALKQNPEIEIQRLAVERARKEVERVSGRTFLPGMEARFQWAPDQRGQQLFGNTFIRTSQSSTTGSLSLFKPFGNASSFGFSYAESRLGGATSFFAPGGGRVTYFTQTGVQYSYPLWSLKRKEFIAPLKQAEISLQLEEVRLQDKISEIGLSVLSAYWDVARKATVLEAREGAVKEAQLTLEAVKAKVSAGRLSGVELSTAEASLAQRNVERESALADYRSAQEQLSVLLNLPFGIDFQVEPLKEPVVSVPWLGDGNGEEAKILKEIIEDSPALQNVSLQQRSAEIELSASRGRGKGDWRLNLTLGLQGTGADYPQSIESLKYTGWQAEMVYSTTFGMEERESAPAQATLSSLQQSYSFQKKRVEQEGRNALRGVQSAIAQAESARQALTSSRKSMEGVRARYDVGFVTLLEVLRAESDVLSAQLVYIDSLYRAHLSLAQLYRLRGKLPPVQS